MVADLPLFAKAKENARKAEQAPPKVAQRGNSKERAPKEGTLKETMAKEATAKERTPKDRAKITLPEAPAGVPKAPPKMPPPRVPKPLAERPLRRARFGTPIITGVPPSKTFHARPVQRIDWKSPVTWIPVAALVMLLTGAWLILPDPHATAWMLPVPDRSLPTVVIDPGHGGKDSGAMNNGLREKDLTLDTALRLERHLRDEGFPVVLTRRDDRFLELFDRAEIANRIPRALFVSIHFNDNTTASGDGVETFYAQQKAAFSSDGWTLAGLFDGQAEPPPLDQGASFAQAVQASMVGHLGVTDRGAKPRQLAVVRLTRCPAVLVEGGFLNNPSEARKLAQDEYRERLATAISNGVAAYMREKLSPPPAVQVAQR